MFEVRKGGRILGGQALEFGPAGDLPFQNVHESLVVPLQDPEP
ncbi:hypothetical protein [Labrys sp. La1]